MVQATQEVRINVAFSSYEREQRELRTANARKRFSVTDLEAELARVMRPAWTEANQLYLAPISEIKAQIATATQQRNESARQLALFDRKYKEELDPL